MTFLKKAFIGFIAFYCLLAGTFMACMAGYMLGGNTNALIILDLIKQVDP